MKMRNGFLAVGLGLALCGFARADEMKSDMSRKPGPEVKKLQPFVGHWKMESKMQPGPMGPGGNGTGTESCEWFPGGYFLVCHSEGKGPMGMEKGLGILGYDPEEKMYTYYGIDNMGMGISAKGTVTGDTWTWTNEMKMGGKTMKTRYTMKEDSATVHTMKWEISEDGEKWKAMMEGKETKASKAAAKAPAPKEEKK